jgi:serine/threonine protein kinase
MRSEKPLRALTDLLSQRNFGDIVTVTEILDATKWVESTLRTYVRKNKLIQFLEELPDGNFKALRSGSSIAYSDIHGALSQTSPAQLILTPGLKLAGKSNIYQLEKKLGEGASAHVWSASINGGETLVALKIINPRPDLLEPSIFRNVSQRFDRESQNGVNLKHDCIVRITDYGKYQTKPFLVMEKAERSVKDLINQNSRLSLLDSYSIVSRCVGCLQYLHSLNCIHRDIKPANILQTDRGFVLADLGIVLWSDLNLSFLEAGTITTASMNLGSLSYMAPEQSNNAHTVGPECDIYALGVTWYEMLSGDRPTPQTFAARGEAPPTKDNHRLNQLIQSMTSYNPSERPTLEDISAFLESSQLPLWT